MHVENEHDTLPPSMDPAVDGGVTEPPRDFLGILKRLGPGLIIAASIVGSGELITTTKTGAQAGIALLWLIIIGCLIKVFVQIELGRYTISHGETTLAALDRVPGPRLRVNWIVWSWLVMMACTIGQLGGIVGGVGQALAVTFPIEGDYAAAVRVPSERDLRRYIAWSEEFGDGSASAAATPSENRNRRGYEFLRRQIEKSGTHGEDVVAAVRRGDPIPEPYTRDDKYWAAIISLITSALLVRGRYGLIQHLSTVLVVAFTFLTIGNVVALQMQDEWRVPLADILHGLSFHLPAGESAVASLKTALAAFGIIGVGATELITYPYWCLEKGYAKFTGPRSDDPRWAERARGWLRVMKYDAFLSMAIYTLATLAFFLMGVAVLHRLTLDPEGMRMVGTLAEAYVPIFGEYARWLFLCGAIAVLYSTFLVASAGNARMMADGMKVYGLIDRHGERTHERAVSGWSFAIPLLCLAVYLLIPQPVQLVIVAGVSQATVLPMLGFAALWLRRHHTDPRIKPGRVWDVLLGLSFLALLIAGVWGVYAQIFK